MHLCRMRSHRQVKSEMEFDSLREDHFKMSYSKKKPKTAIRRQVELIADLKLVFEDTSGEYVGIVPTIDDSPTIMIDQNELTQRIQTNDDTQPVEDSDSNAYLGRG